MKMTQLYRARWISEAARANISIAVAAMQEKCTLFGILEMPDLRPIDSMAIERSVPARRHTTTDVPRYDPSSFSLNENALYHHHHDTAAAAGAGMPDATPMLPKQYHHHQFDSAAEKQDSRVVNEAFQDAVVYLEDGLTSKMQAEMLVLVDVLHKPAAIFPGQLAVSRALSGPTLHCQVSH